MEAPNNIEFISAGEETFCPIENTEGVKRSPNYDVAVGHVALTTTSRPRPQNNVNTATLTKTTLV